MIIEETLIEGCFIITQQPFCDERGYFTRVFCSKEMKVKGISVDFVQSNLCCNEKKNTLRGLHMQKGESAEEKLVVCTRGSVFDVCVDLRKHLTSYGKYTAFELSETNGRMLYIPKGCAHGYITLEDNCQLLYFMTSHYAKEDKTGYRYDDPFFSIKWPIGDNLIISDDDLNWKFIDI